MKKLLIFPFLVFLIVFSYKIYPSFSKSIWDGKNRINIIFEGQQIFVFSLNPPEKEGIFLSIPSQTFVEVIHGYGQYRIEVIYQLGELENYHGGELLAESIQENLRIPIDAYASIPNVKSQTPDIKTYILDSFRFLIGNGKTNLTKWDLLRLWLEVKKIRQDKILTLDLENTAALEKVVLADKTEWFKINPEMMEKIARDFFKDSKIRQEELTIAILNSTSHQGLAARAASLVENIGGRVVEIGDGGLGTKENLSLEIERCEIRSEKRFKKSYTLKKLAKIFSCNWKGEEKRGFRAEVVLTLGEDYWKKLTEKW